MNDKLNKDDDVARMFRENDDIGSDSSLWLRPLRQLFKEGKPIGQVIALTVSPNGNMKLPFGMLTQTEKNRLIFWPILPKNANIIYSGICVDLFDHITLEFPSKKIHVTAYDTKGLPIHVANSWRAVQFVECELALWFTLLVRVSILREQDLAVQRRVLIPSTDNKRRTDEFISYTRNLDIQNISLPPKQSESEYIYLRLYLAPNSITAHQFSSSILPVDSGLDSEIEGWNEGNVFQIAVTPLMIGQRTICVATACPPGKLRTDVSIGLPRSIN